MTAFHGVIPPIITPYDRSGGIHAEALRRLIDWYADAGCHGLWVCGGTGEGVSLTTRERDEMIALSCQHAAGRLRVIFHVAAPTTAQAVAAAERCQSEGTDAICSVPPYFYGKSTPEVVDYYRALADATDRPIFLYNLPDASGLPLTLPLVEAIVKRVPTVVGIKQSAGVVDYVAQLLKWKPDLTVLIGRGETTLAALTLGATGVVCASLCMAPERFVAVYQAFQDGDLRRAIEAQRFASSVKDLYDEFPVIASTKWVNSQQLGIDCGAPRAPLASIAPERERELRRMAEALELLGPAASRREAEPVGAATAKPR
ncbi:MAG: dihydrodipicolinate synthase family protein [Pirellulales bacterium]|nr:dihydrodipicolinate synthase family protein [Pirellulales bacterium]